MKIRRNTDPTPATIPPAPGLPTGYDDNTSPFYIPEELRGAYVEARSTLSREQIEERATTTAQMDAWDTEKANHQAEQSSRAVYTSPAAFNMRAPGLNQRVKNATERAMLEDGDTYRARVEHGSRLANARAAALAADNARARRAHADREHTCEVCGRVDQSTRGRCPHEVAGYKRYAYTACTACHEAITERMAARRRETLPAEALARATELAGSLPLQMESLT